MDISLEISQRVKHIQDVLDKYMPPVEGYQRTIFDAMNYSVKAGGKRIRPMLMEATYKMFGGEDKLIDKIKLISCNRIILSLFRFHINYLAANHSIYTSLLR